MTEVYREEKWTFIASILLQNFTRLGDFPGCPVVKAVLPLQVARVQSLLWELRSHMLRAKQLSPHATATEAMPLRACALQQEKAPWREARTPTTRE